MGTVGWPEQGFTLAVLLIKRKFGFMKRWIFVAIVALVAVGLPKELWAQGCAVCTKTASELDGHSARGLNAGILYLAFLPLSILGTVGYFWWRGSRAAK